MVVYYSTPRQVRQQHAECRREEERARKARAHFWRDLDADMERARVRGEYFDTQMACKYGWNRPERKEKMSETVMGQIRVHRELSLEEQRERFGQQCRDAQALDRLIEAISRHPAAENDPSVIDAVNAIEDILRQKEAG